MKNFVVIGGASGIGAAVVAQLLNDGHSVFTTYNTTALEISHPNLTSTQLEVVNGVLDDTDLPAVIDGLVYCPGSINLKPFTRIKPQDFVADYELQVVGAIKLIQQMLPKLKASSAASIVLFSTVAVGVGFPFHSQVSASKGAVEGLTKALAAEFAPTIRVNCIAPSLTDTPLANRFVSTADKKAANGNRHPLKRIGTPQDITNMVAFLCSEQSSWMTGQILHVDGGMSTLKL